MIGAIIGDIVGSRFEHSNHKSKEFEMFDKKCKPTDDSIMSLAVAKAILDCNGNYEDLSARAISSMQELGRIYKNAGYGASFIKWLFTDNPQPYNSFGNGAAMRVGCCGYTATSTDDAKELSAKVTKISHNHPEGIKGAEAVAVTVFLSRNGMSKEEIKEYIRENYYEINFSLDEIRETYKFDLSCQGSVPVAFEAFFESSDFEDALRNAISVGGDSDTIAAITGTIAEAYYGIPEGIINSAIAFLDSREMEILYSFEKAYLSKALNVDGEALMSVFDVLDAAVNKSKPTVASSEEEGKSSMDSKEPMHGEISDKVGEPDAGSFDKSDSIKKTKKLLEKTGSDITKTANKIGKNLLSTATILKKPFDHIKEKAASQTVTCHEIVSENPEDTEKTMGAVKALKEAGYETKVLVTKGTMFGYVFVKGEDFEKACNLLKPMTGIMLEKKPVDKAALEKRKKKH